MILIATGFISLSPLSVVTTMVMWGSSQWLEKNIVRSTGFLKKKKKKLQETTDRCIGRRDITEILLKTA